MPLFDNLANQAARGLGNAATNAANNAARNTAHNVTQAAAGSLRNLQNKRETFTFQSLPQTVAELQALPQASLASPYGTAALAIAALCAYEQDPQAVADMLNFLRGPRPLTPYDLQFLRDRLRGKCYKTFSFFEGATPQNNYTPSRPYRVTVSDNPYSWVSEDSSQSSGGPVQYARLLLQSSGADSPRFITMRLKPSTGQWFLWDHQLLADIRIPAAADAWA